MVLKAPAVTDWNVCGFASLVAAAVRQLQGRAADAGARGEAVERQSVGGEPGGLIDGRAAVIGPVEDLLGGDRAAGAAGEADEIGGSNSAARHVSVGDDIAGPGVGELVHGPQAHVVGKRKGAGVGADGGVGGHHDRAGEGDGVGAAEALDGAAVVEARAADGDRAQEVEVRRRTELETAAEGGDRGRVGGAAEGVVPLSVQGAAGDGDPAGVVVVGVRRRQDLAAALDQVAGAGDQRADREGGVGGDRRTSLTVVLPTRLTE